MLHQRVSATYQKIFNQAPALLINSPGRINLIGEHTDYNDGFVLPAAIDKSIVLAFSAREDDQVSLHSLDMNESTILPLTIFEKSDFEWANYIIGVLQQFHNHHHQITGFNCVFGGDIPIGAGLSSSAALECGVGYGLNILFDLGIARKQIALLGQAAENEFVGVKCGIMDQFANMLGKAEHVIRLDCESLEFEYFPFHANGIDIVLLDTQVKHSLASSEYNKRREECEAGVHAMQALNPSIKSLRYATLQDLKGVQNNLSVIEFNRCTYVIEEIERIQVACKMLEKNDLQGFGKKMYETHAGLQYLYEVSCPELDFFADYASKQPAVLGARMMGGGFGGCTINLIPKHATDGFIAGALEAYATTFHKQGKAHVVQVGDGTGIIS